MLSSLGFVYLLYEHNKFSLLLNAFTINIYAMQDAIAADNRRVAVFIKTVLVWHRALQSVHKQDHLDGMDQIHSQEDVEWGI